MFGEIGLAGMILAFLIGLGIFIALAEGLLMFGKRDNKWGFGIIFVIFYITPIANLVFNLMTSINPFVLISIGLMVFLLGYIGNTLFVMAGENQRRWFYLTLLFPILAFVYNFVD